MKEINENELKEVNGGYDLSSLPPEMTERQDNDSLLTVECIKSCYNTITDSELKNQCAQKCVNDYNNKTGHYDPYDQAANVTISKYIDTIKSLH